MKHAKQPQFIIKDWAGNIMWQGRAFESFEDAWGFIYEQFGHLEESDFDDQMSEYEVVEE